MCVCVCCVWGSVVEPRKKKKWEGNLGYRYMWAREQHQI